MFQGFKGSYYALRYGRKANQMEEAYTFCLENCLFKCRYCREELGLLHKIKVEDFLEHMAKEHPDKVDMKKVDKFKALFKFLKK